jgi:hypothetical protein
LKATRTALIALLVSLLFAPGRSQKTPTGATPSEPVLRGPFTLNLQTDKQHTYQKQFDKAPYVLDNEVHLFVKDNFGVNLTVAGDQITGVAYQPKLRKCDVTFRFTQEKTPRGPMMLLVIENKTRHRLSMDAAMSVPNQDGFIRTSIVAIPASLSDFESWPNPIVQLVLRNLRFSDVAQGPAPSKTAPSIP